MPEYCIYLRSLYEEWQEAHNRLLAYWNYYLSPGCNNSYRNPEGFALIAHKEHLARLRYERARKEF